MFERQQIEKMLVAHGINPTAADEEIRAVLVSAEWHEDDIEAAIYVLRDNNHNNQSHVDALHQVFRTDERMRPETIKALLGIDIDINSRDVIKHKRHARGKLALSQIINISLTSIALAVVCLLLAMWYMKVGFFHYTGL